MPERVRAEVDRWLGSRVVSAVTQPTGFSPGVAVRLTTEDGRRVFAKAVGPEPNADAPTFHRREIAIAASPPDAAPSPRLLWSYDEGPSQNRHSREGGNPGVGGGRHHDEERRAGGYCSSSRTSTAAIPPNRGVSTSSTASSRRWRSSPRR